MRLQALFPIVAFAAFLSVLGEATAQRRTDELPNRVAAGDVTQDSVVLWARAPRPGAVVFQLARRPDFRGPSRWFWQWVGDETVPGKVEVDGLRPGTRYHYRVVAGLRNVSTGTFRTAHAAGRRAGLRFGVSGDSRGELAPYPSVRNAVDRDLDFFVALGDTIYADVPSPAVPVPQATTIEEYRLKHDEVHGDQLGLPAWAELRASTACFGLIDDHEVINDFSGGAAPSSDPRFPDNGEGFINETALYENGLRAFTEYYPIRDERYGDTGDARTAHKRKLYRARRFGDDAAVFLLDARSFRDEALPSVTDLNDFRAIVDFLTRTFDPTRTMLGAQQLADLEADLLAAQRDGVEWKFVFVPEPIQNLGVLFASDRFEGYAAERTRILSFIDANDIDNVVFVAADLHGTLVNDLSYQTMPFGPQIRVPAFEVITGAIAYDAPLAPTVIQIAVAIGLVDPAAYAFYLTLPRPVQDQIFELFTNGSIEPFGYDALGLDGGPIRASLQQGLYTAAHTYGWTEFEIEAATGVLTVTTYGIPPYTRADIETRPAEVLGRMPEVVSRFVVTPH